MNDAIEIKISKQETDGMQQAKPDVKTDPSKPSLQAQAINTALINMSKQIMMQGFKAYGDISGDYAAVNMVDTALGIGADLITLSLGPVGWIAVGAKHTTQIIGQQSAIYLSNQEINRQRERMGVLITRGSRYGGE